MRLYNTILIGAGKIGLGNDDYKKYRSHLYTLAKDKNINLVAILDNDKKKIKKISKKYNFFFFNKIEDVRHLKVDLLVISTPTKTHYRVIMACLKNLKPKMILVEKPLGGDLMKAKLIKNFAKKKKVKIFVNYMRLSLPATTLLKNMLKNKNVIGNVLYSNGLINNGSHFINLCIYLFGKIQRVKIIDKKILNKFELNSNFILFFRTAQIKFNFVNSKKNYHYVKLFTKNLSVNWEKSKKIELIRKLSKKLKSSKLETQLDKYQYLVLKNLKLSFQNRKFRLCSIDDCIKTLVAIKKIQNLK